MWRSGKPVREEMFLSGGRSPCKPKSLNFPLLLDITPHQKTDPPSPVITDQILEKKVFLIDFSQSLSNFLPEACILSNTIMTYLKKLIGTISLNTTQFPAELSLRIIPRYPPKYLWETLGIGENPTQRPKIYSFPPTEKFPLINLLFLLSKVSFRHHEIVTFI